MRPGVFTVDPWAVIEPELNLDLLPQTESIFALSNGHIGMRGNFDEGEPHGESGTYLNGFFEAVPLPYAESGYGYPEEGQSLINVTNGKLIRLLVDDEPFDVRLGETSYSERALDLRRGVLRRDVTWTSPARQTVNVRSTRLVSFVQRAVAAISYEVEAVGEPARITVQSTLVANEPVAGQADDPRSAAALRAPLIGEFNTHHGLEASLGHRTAVSGLRMAAGMDHLVAGPEATSIHIESDPDLARVTVTTELDPGEKLRIVKFVAYGWSSVRSMPALRDQVDGSLAAARRTGWDALVQQQEGYLAELWKCADIEVDGDPELQQALRFALFQVMQAGARAEQRAIPAKGLTGRGYDGHTFWDMETYTLPVLTYTAPDAAADALRWRHSTLDLALARAKELRLQGASFPWRTIRGEECSGYWPAGTASFHVNADIADAVRRYVAATEDDDFERGPGLELLVETSRLWMGLGHHDPEGRFRIDGVTGPDEYSALIDNNTFTNLMAARNLDCAADAATRWTDEAKALAVDDAEIAAWREAAAAIVVPFDEELGVTAQSEGFTRYRPWDFEATSSDEYPLLLHYPYYLLYSSQVVKQADLVFALYLFGDRFSAEQKQRDFDHYEAITVRDSTLSAPIQAVVAAEVGHLDLALDYLREASMVDMRDLAGNTADGLHIASLAGTWLAVVGGFGGLRDHTGGLAFSPRLPPGIDRLCFGVRYRGRSVRVSLTPGEARYEMLDGDPLELHHHGEPVTLTSDEPLVFSCPDAPPCQPVGPPSGREALREGVGANGDVRPPPRGES